MEALSEPIHLHIGSAGASDGIRLQPTKQSGVDRDRPRVPTIDAKIRHCGMATLQPLMYALLNAFENVLLGVQEESPSASLQAFFYQDIKHIEVGVEH